MSAHVSSRAKGDPGQRWLEHAALLCVFVGLFAATVLSSGYLLDLPVPCGRSRGCQAVAMLPASRIFGVPIVYVGVGAWLLLLGLLTATPRSRRATWWLVVVSGVGSAISAGLLIHAHTAIGATCLWCAASGIAMTLLFFLSLPLLRRPVPRPPLHPVALWGLALACALAAGAQAGAMGKAARKPPVASSVLAKLSTEELTAGRGAIGPANAPLTVVMFGDLWCGACRDAMDGLRRFQHEHPQAVRVVYRHLPLWEIPGHQFSGTSAALAEVASEEGKFWQFIDQLHGQPRPPDPAGFLSLLSGLGISPEGIEDRLANPDDPAVARVRRDMDLADRLGLDSTPPFLILADGQPALSTGPHQLPVLLESPVVQQLLLRARL